MPWHIILSQPKMDVFNKQKTTPSPVTLAKIGKRVDYSGVYATKEDAEDYCNRNCNNIHWNFEIQEIDDAEQPIIVKSISSGVTPAINDHVCPLCKNNRCSKTEKECWRCGNPLH